MEGDLVTIKRKLENIKPTHPNLYKLWEKYINIKIKRHGDFITECNVFLENVNLRPDMGLPSIATLMALKDVYNTKTN